MTSGWSTRELAEIAGTTLKTVRHYHRLGLLDEPERTANGYKQYRIKHLIRLLRIRRLVDLGVPLADIATIEESDEGADQVFRALDAELAASIERQQRVRDELAAILQHRGLAELPPGFDRVAAELSDADRSFLLLSPRIFGPVVTEALARLHAAPRTEVGREFDELGDDASEETRPRVAEQLIPEILRDQRSHQELQDMADRVAAGEVDPIAVSVLVQAVAELHNAAQIDVLQRVNKILYLH